MNFIEEFKQRGFYFQCTNIEELSKQEEVTAYIGFDCTAPSLHLGSLMQIMILRLLKKYNHDAIILLGGTTTKIGDPSGKDEARKLLTQNEIEFNLNGIKSVISKFINEPFILNNSDWLENINYIDFLREFGTSFSINKMLSFDCIKNRINNKQGLSFLEFNYMMLQSYDFLYLRNQYGCNLQIGGSDQWGNMVSGVDLLKKDGKLGFGLTTPLLTTTNGNKMGKTENGAIWLDGDPFEYYQYFRNTKDEDVIKFLKLFTELDLEEIKKFSKLQGHELNSVKEILAKETTKICFGKSGLDQALIKTYEKFSKI